MKKSLIFLLLALSLMFIFLASCKQEETAPTPQPTTSQAQPTTVQEQPTSGDIKVLAKDLVDELVKEDFAGVVKTFDATMKTALPEDNLKKAWTATTTSVGPFKKQVSTRTEKEQIYDVVYVTCEFEKTKLDIKVVFNDKKEVSGLFFLPVTTTDEKASKDTIPLAKGLVDELVKEDFAGVVKKFDTTMKAALTEDKLKDAWTATTTQVGPFKKQLSTKTEKMSIYDIVYVTCEFEKAKLDVKVVFNDKKEVSGLFFVPSAGN